MAWITRCRRCGLTAIFHSDKGLWEHHFAAKTTAPFEVVMAADDDHDPKVGRFWRFIEAVFYAPRDIDVQSEKYPNDLSRSTTVSLLAGYRRLTVEWNRPWEPPERTR